MVRFESDLVVYKNSSNNNIDDKKRTPTGSANKTMPL